MILLFQEKSPKRTLKRRLRPIFSLSLNHSFIPSSHFNQSSFPFLPFFPSFFHYIFPFSFPLYHITSFFHLSIFPSIYLYILLSIYLSIYLSNLYSSEEMTIGKALMLDILHRSNVFGETTKGSGQGEGVGLYLP